MTIDEAIRRCYDKLGNHRAVARMLSLPIHYVMFVVGLMTESTFNKVNGHA